MIERSDIVDTLAGLALFADLTRPQLEAVAHTFEEEWFNEDQRILRQGLAGSAFYVLLEGEVAVKIDGETRSTLGRGDFFGEVSVLLGGPPKGGVDPALPPGPLPCRDRRQWPRRPAIELLPPPPRHWPRRDLVRRGAGRDVPPLPSVRAADHAVQAPHSGPPQQPALRLVRREQPAGRRPVPSRACPRLHGRHLHLPVAAGNGARDRGVRGAQPVGRPVRLP